MLNNQSTMPMLTKDLGMQFASENSKQKGHYGLYICSCGNEFKSLMTNIKRGNTKSCGCYNIAPNTKHGLYHHPLYTTWRAMVQRCTKPNYKGYENYGGRGITVCDRWLDVSNFIEDMEPSYQNGLSIDRIDTNGNYEPINCRWATRTVQSRNTRKIMATNTSGYRGVCFNKQMNKWVAGIRLNGKRKHLGCYKTSLEAAMAYNCYVVDNNLEHTINRS